jgi:hypothetical protein
MITLVFAMLLLIGVTGLFTSYTMLGGVIQLSLVVALVALGINRIRRFRID